MAFSFGSTTSNASAAPKPFSFGGFGSNANTGTSTPAPAANPFALGSSTTSGGASQAKAPFSFGSTPSTSTGATGSSPAPFSFGTTSSNQQGATTQGSTPASNPFGSFGASTSTNNTAGASNPFAPKPAGASGFGGFGSTFGQSTTNSTSQPFSLGLGQSTLQQQQQQPQQQQLTLSALSASTRPANFQEAYRPPPASIEDRLRNIQNAWDPNNPACRFSFFFYNTANDPITVPLTELAPPANVACSPLRIQGYKQAVNENPRPEKYVPVLATSMDDLQKRVNIQKQTTSAHLNTLKSKELQGKIQEGNKKHWSETSVRIDKLNREQVRLEERLVRFCARLAGLQTPSASSSVPNESDLLMMLERIRNELGGAPVKARAGQHAGGARLAGIVNELWMVVSQRKALMMGSRSATPDGTSAAEWGVVDEAELQKVLEVLSQQQKSLDYLSKQLRLHLLDIDTCRIGFGLPLLSNQQDQRQDRAAIMTS